MYSPDKFKNKAVRSKPLQARGKERVRVILAAALDLYKQRGIDAVTTNDIAERADIPIGSLYRYYPNKDSITAALTELYVEDISAIFDDIAANPMLGQMSWEEILFLMIDGWVNYSRLNGPYTFLYAEVASPSLSTLTRPIWMRFSESFSAVLTKRCPALTSRQVEVCFRLSIAAADIGSNSQANQAASQEMCSDAVGAIGAYMFKICRLPEHHADVVLS